MLDVGILLPQSLEERQEAVDNVEGIEVLEVYLRVINIHELLNIV